MQRGQIIAIASQKGGVGKTTLSLNTGYAFAQRGWRTLLIDTDPQGSIGCSIRGDLRENAGLAEVLRSACSTEDAIVKTRLANFQVLPIGQIPPVEIARWSFALEDGQSLGRVFDPLRESYDLILVDTPPAISGSALGAIRQADHVVIPLQAEPLAARSVSGLIEVLRDLRNSGSQVRLSAIVVTMLQSRNDASLGVAQESWKLFPQDLVLEASIPRDPDILAASAAGVPVGLLRRRPPAIAAVFDQIAADLELRFDLEEDSDDAIPLLG